MRTPTIRRQRLSSDFPGRQRSRNRSPNQASPMREQTDVPAAEPDPRATGSQWIGSRLTTTPRGRVHPFLPPPTPGWLARALRRNVRCCRPSRVQRLGSRPVCGAWVDLQPVRDATPGGVGASRSGRIAGTDRFDPVEPVAGLAGGRVEGTRGYRGEEEAGLRSRGLAPGFRAKSSDPGCFKSCPHTYVPGRPSNPQSGSFGCRAGAQYVWRRAISRSIMRSMTRYFSIRRRSSFASGV